MSNNLKDKIGAYQPSKTIWFWSTAATAALTMFVGFTWGGWVTGGTATDRAETAAAGAVAELASAICVERFLQAGDALMQLAALREESSFRRNGFVEDGGWVTFAGAEKPVKGAGKLCAAQLMEAELPEPAAALPVADATEAVTPS
jgi:hypothetical protein